MGKLENILLGVAVFLSMVAATKRIVEQINYNKKLNNPRTLIYHTVAPGETVDELYYLYDCNEKVYKEDWRNKVEEINKKIDQNFNVDKIKPGYNLIIPLY
ncbi:MAG: hypothetical protein NZ889_00820 [Candidatus Pacearchaeota archaeon]|nr:hypothetical protein [Candidatus Pacearchaeota archaeon]